jgi:NAD-reducing hydrogenase large subunit
MARRIDINPVTRIEGHGKVTLQLDDSGRVSNATFSVTQFRGFEKLAEGRPFQEMPALMARTCGICPISHLMAGAKAGDAILAVKIPPTGEKLRRIVNLAQIFQSHALSFFHLSSPDLLLGFDGDPAGRNLFGLVAKYPEVAKDGIFLRRFGQEIIAKLAGKRIHPAWVVPGGVSSPLAEEAREAILADVPRAQAALARALELFKPIIARYKDEIDSFANFDSLYVGLVDRQGRLEHYDGVLRIKDAAGQIVLDGFDPARYDEVLQEQIEPFSYLKSPYYAPLGYPNGMYRVGPLARLNVADSCGTPKADAELTEFRKLGAPMVKSAFYYHYARLIEMLYALETIEALLNDRDILSEHVRAEAGVNSLEGVGVCEAPRGTLIHHYRVNRAGLITWVNLIIATGHNNLAINRGVLQVAQRFVDGNKLQEGMLNRVEAVVRTFDPCLSCSTHALGQMPLVIELVDAAGEVLDTLRRY